MGFQLTLYLLIYTLLIHTKCIPWGSIKETCYYFNKPSLNEHKMKEKYLGRKTWAQMILSCYLLITQNDEQVIKNYWKTLQVWRHGRRSSIKIYHYETLSNVPFWNGKQCTAIIKCISVTLDCNPLIVTETSYWFRIIKLFTKYFHVL